MNLKFDFTDREILITGGARGLGLEMTKSFLDAGARVAIWDSSDENLECAKNELNQLRLGSRLRTLKVDVTDRQSVAAAAASISGLEVLINNAGITRDKTLAKMSDEDFDAVINTNLRAVFVVTQNLLGKFKPDSAVKRVINISSVVALYGSFGQTNYVAAKAGVIGMTKTWARELGPKGFTVNAIAPGFIKTPMTDKMPPDVLKSMVEKIPTRRLGEPADIAKACLFLASEEASYLNGATLSVDGGLVV